MCLLREQRIQTDRRLQTELSFCHKRAGKRHRANETDSHPRKPLRYKTRDCQSHKGRENISNTLKRLNVKLGASSAGFSWAIAKWSSTSAKRQYFHSIFPTLGGITEICQSLRVTAFSVLNPCLGKVWIYAVKPKIETGTASGNCLLQKCQRMQKGWGWRRFSVPQAAFAWTKRYFK